MSHDLLFHMSDVACVRAEMDDGWKSIHLHLLKLCQAEENSGYRKRPEMIQTQKIVNHIKKNGSITQREAYIDYGIQSFHRRLTDLAEMGHEIVRIQRKHPTTGQMYSRYYLSKEAKVAA